MSSQSEICVFAPWLIFTVTIEKPAEKEEQFIFMPGDKDFGLRA
jgi:hypothetical protein